ncbi:MAG: hypothetical protein Ct9H300mP7_3200 [Verrucomicrobiota bacterium]|nr:MAG: hypothetical protein Ct9H300mP7_3200 [Verrucomicrobiota bacterium]
MPPTHGNHSVTCDWWHQVISTIRSNAALTSTARSYELAPNMYPS